MKHDLDGWGALPYVLSSFGLAMMLAALTLVGNTGIRYSLVVAGLTLVAYGGVHYTLLAIKTNSGSNVDRPSEDSESLSEVDGTKFVFSRIAWLLIASVLAYCAFLSLSYAYRGYVADHILSTYSRTLAGLLGILLALCALMVTFPTFRMPDLSTRMARIIATSSIILLLFFAWLVYYSGTRLPGPSGVMPTPTPTYGERQLPAGNLRPSNSSAAFANSYGTVVNFVAQARFYNPYDVSFGTWDYGFSLKSTSNESARYAIFVDSSRQWTGTMVGDETGEDSGKLGGLDVSKGGSNLLQLVVALGKGYFFVNKSFISVVDLSEFSSGINVSIMAGIVDVNRVTGYTTRYDDFSIWSGGAHGPASGTISLLNNRATFFTSHTDTMNCLVSVVFENPYDISKGSWNYGIRLRDTKDGARFEIGLNSEGFWWTDTLTPGQPRSAIETQPIDNIKLSEGDENELRVIALNGFGYLFVNSKFAGNVNLTSHSNPGDVAATMNFDQYHSPTQNITKFKSFEVVTLDS